MGNEELELINLLMQHYGLTIDEAIQVAAQAGGINPDAYGSNIYDAATGDDEFGIAGGDQNPGIGNTVVNPMDLPALSMGAGDISDPMGQPYESTAWLNSNAYNPVEPFHPPDWGLDYWKRMLPNTPNVPVGNQNLPLQQGPSEIQAILDAMGRGSGEQRIPGNVPISHSSRLPSPPVPTDMTSFGLAPGTDGWISTANPVPRGRWPNNDLPNSVMDQAGMDGGTSGLYSTVDPDSYTGMTPYLGNPFEGTLYSTERQAPVGKAFALMGDGITSNLTPSSRRFLGPPTWIGRQQLYDPYNMAPSQNQPPDDMQTIGMDNAQLLENELNRFTGDGPSFDPSPQEGPLSGLGAGGLRHPWGFPDRTNERNSSAFFGNGEPKESTGAKARMAPGMPPGESAANDILAYLLEKAMAAGRPTQGLERAVSNQARPTAPPGRRPAATQVRSAALKSNPQRTAKPNPPATRARTVVAPKPAPAPVYRPPVVVAKPVYRPPVVVAKPAYALSPVLARATTAPSAKPTSALLKAPR
jgi:hypothetical protein